MFFHYPNVLAYYCYCT